ncbi:MAG: CRISPR-associated protein Cas4 [Armatimonadetes bacterium]|nr:CRISPR-associated protein Cas4 [Armatimonadota bacterium]
MAADDEGVMLSAIDHYAYCPRRCALIHVEQVWDENVFTLQGAALHERADEGFTTFEAGKRIERALPLWSEELGLIGKADTVEFLADGSVRPVEYKRGARAARAQDDLQLCAQALCLEEMLGVPVTTGAIFYHASRRTREVVFDDKLRAATREAIAQVRDLLRTGRIPPPVNDARCRDCSLLHACQPQALAAAAGLDEDELFTPPSDEEMEE